ncbi:uncharacterized protein TRIADDRAFT_21543 [Trichoplax adhaerens]|uniref:Calpain catalytic domain-containing protein n=1 Tax=Trichoplax adhaerens TaxID=10228 RepID=B3RNL8_TRIAD|nr:hypothetical protein TRIADDRAFT_21543 [Trichoplax adhaerens]EDV27479.1 hypothetical protein TRIADDRAFT_21543 [Trichoplax adhaerens]|eukprot:XP_002109313.1 hypothetical protein TRIADDRAFT_21543 [Trichoplax adhaerens]
MSAPSPITQYKDQDYNALKAQCLESGKLFEDPTFPANDSSLYYDKRESHGIVWLRPKEITDDPKLYVDGGDRLDMRQGRLGDCWFVASLSSLATEKNLLYRVIPNDQTFDKDYAGILHVRFWRMGQWADIVIDDRLPCFEKSKRPCYVHPSDKHEFWGCFIEKAYAKVNNSYEALVGGVNWEALETFTGGIHEDYHMPSMPADGFQRIFNALARHSLLGCFGVTQLRVKGHVLPNGLVWGHAYSVDKAAKIEGNDEEVPLVRIRNPWGCGEWKGAWSDGSAEWDTVSEETKKAIGMAVANNGEFWMSYEDFISNYVTLEICMLKPDIEYKDGNKMKWNFVEVAGEWKKGVNAGGCWNFRKTYHTNPQIRFEIPEDDTPEGTSIFIALMQMFTRPFAGEHKKTQSICFTIYRVEGDQVGKRLDENYLLHHRFNARCKAFGRSAEISNRFTFKKGHYVVIPVTYKPDEETKFCLRIFTEKPINVTK